MAQRTHAPERCLDRACVHSICSSDFAIVYIHVSSAKCRLGAQEFIVYFSADDEYWRLHAKKMNKKNFRIAKRKLSKQSQPQPGQESPARVRFSEDVTVVEDDSQREACMFIGAEQMFPVANLRLLFMLTAEAVRRSGYLATERPTALALIGLSAMVAVSRPCSYSSAPHIAHRILVSFSVVASVYAL
eukprot:COSAG02_NODE_5591_length_4206_cov_3.054298_3_plen_188_part_00